jgi:hypothetical protein
MAKIDTFLNQVTTYKGFVGWVLNFIGKTVRVAGKAGETFYYHKDQLMKQLFQASHFDSTYAQRKNLATTFREVLHPIEGRDIQVAKVRGIFASFSKSFATKKPGLDEINEKFEKLKNRHITVLKLSDGNFVNKLKPGDLLFKKNPVATKHIVSLAQRVFKGFTLAKLRDAEGYKYSHVAMYIGNNQIAEAMTDSTGGVQIRKLDINDPRFSKLSDGQSFMVTRPKDSALGKKAVEIANSISCTATSLEDEMPQDRNPHKYAFMNAFRSLFHSCSFGPFARQRYLKQYIDARNKEAPQSFVFHRNFYCSNFVSYCYQAAEGQTVAKEILGADSKPPAAKTRLGKALYRGIWARVNSWKHYRALSEKVKLQYDAKWITPQDLRHFIVGHPKLFTDRILIKQ